MTDTKILQAIEGLRKLFIKRGIGKIDYPHNRLLRSKVKGLKHCHGMLDQMVIFVQQGRRDKAFRWLGFIQGVIWFDGLRTLNYCKNLNRP